VGYTITRGIPTLARGPLRENKDKPKNTSAHSGYKCIIGCGDNGYTPTRIDYYFNPKTNKDIPLQNYYDAIHVESSKAKFNSGNN
jgi:hypothetical protein